MSHRIDRIRSDWPDIRSFLLKQTKNVKLIRRIIMNHPLNPMTDPSGYPMNHPINLTDNPIGLKSAYLTDGSSDIRIDQIRIAPLNWTKSGHEKFQKFFPDIFWTWKNFRQILDKWNWTNSRHKKFWTNSRQIKLDKFWTWKIPEDKEKFWTYSRQYF